MFDQEDISLSPINFFQLKVNCPYLKDPKELLKLNSQKLEPYLLPDTSFLCGEMSFAKVALAWSEEGIGALAIFKGSFNTPAYPEITRGDSFELMIDTRDVKTSGYNTRFCHHFFFLPEQIEGKQAGEITHFRTEDRHELCDSSELFVQFTSSSKLQIFIPRNCLHGFDPEQFDRMGFTYRINRHQGEPQHFSAITKEYQIEQQPSLWASARLLR